MKKFALNPFYYLSNTDPVLVRESSHWAKAKGILVGVLILLSSCLAGISMFYFIYEATGSELAALVFSTLWMFTVMHIEKSVYLSVSKWAIMIRIIMIAIIAFLVSLPLKINLFGDALNQEMKAMRHDEKVRNYQQVADQEAQNSGIIQKLTNELNELKDQRDKMVRMRGAEEKGLTIYGQSTGKAGRGNRWNALNAQVLGLEQSIIQKNEQIKKAKIENAQQIAKKKEMYKVKNEGINESQSFFYKYKAYKRLLTSNDQLTKSSTQELSLIAYLVLIIIELSPVILKSLLPKTDYDKEIEENQKLIKEAQDFRSHTMLERIHYIGHSTYRGDGEEQFIDRMKRFTKAISELVCNYKKPKE